MDTALASQATIGWVHTFRGFVSVAWGLFDSATPQVQAANKHTRVQQPMVSIIRALQDYSLTLWAHRNEVLHAVGSDTSAIVYAALNHHITQMYALQSSFSPIIQSYFSIPLDERLSRSPRQRKRWLRLVRLATSNASALGVRQQILPTYFPYAPPVHTLQFLSSRSTNATSPVVPTIPPNRRQLSLQQFFSSSDD